MAEAPGHATRSTGEKRHRLHLIEHNGQRVLFIDHRHARADEVKADLVPIQEYITSQPLNSVLVLTDWTEAEITKAVLTDAKKVAVYDRPHVKRSAIIAPEKLRELVKALEMFSARNLAIFETREQALKWLTGEK